MRMAQGHLRVFVKTFKSLRIAENPCKAASLAGSFPPKPHCREFVEVLKRNRFGGQRHGKDGVRQGEGPRWDGTGSR